MFFNTSYLLSNVTNQTDINILLDAFAIHARNLFEFLYPKPTNQRKPDDVVVYDYIKKQGFYRNNKTPKKELLFVWRKASKQVTHLTYTRNRYSKTSKPWPFVFVRYKMRQSLIAFYSALPIEKQSWHYFNELSKLLN